MDKKISEEINGAPAQGADEVRIRRGTSNFKLTLSAILSYISSAINNIYSTIVGIQNDSYNWGIDNGQADSLILNLTPAPKVLTDGMIVRIRAKYANLTTTPYINIVRDQNYSWNKLIVKNGNQPLVIGDITAGMELQLKFNNANNNFELMNSKSGGSTGKERRHDYQITYDYCGTAAEGSAENVAVWTITRITLNANGTTGTSKVINMKWSDHLTINY